MEPKETQQTHTAAVVETDDNMPKAPQQSMEQPPKSKKKFPFFLVPGILALVLIAGGTYAYFNLLPSENKPTPQTPGITDISFRKFTSEEEFSALLAESEKMNQSFLDLATPEFAVEAPQAVGEDAATSGSGGGATRVSETNIQVGGIDEPDIVKTDGTNIYFSSEDYYIMPLRREMIVEDQAVEIAPAEPAVDILPPDLPQSETRVINALPPVDLGQIGNIEQTGEMLLSDNTLMIFQNYNVFAYDVSSPDKPTEAWNIDLGDDTRLVTSRLFEGNLYLVIATNIDSERPCPVGGILCTDIYYPTIPLATLDTTYTVQKIDPLTGEETKSISFVGNSNVSYLYMSENALYVAYSYHEDYSNLLFEFYEGEGASLLPEQYRIRISKLSKLDISNEAKMTEIGVITQEYLSSLNSNDRLKFNNEYQNALSDYSQSKLRELQKTVIVKINNNNLTQSAIGQVPGSPLNQFSFDEYEGNLRLATTLSGGRFGFVADSANDVYVLDSNLKIIGEVTNLGITERIYSTRFIGDKGYVVTFRQIDPFYVIDLSDPSSPKMAGELKIPGYSSYLHPIADNVILGVGEQEGKVKLTLFDVSSPENPTELDTYILDEFWTEVNSNHHAFLQDAKHEIFFLPASQGGYVLGYTGNNLVLTKAIETRQAKRAIFINDYLYVISEEGIIVLNETDWTTINELDF